jgi:hypothetical protein
MRRIEREGGVELLMKVLTEHNLHDNSNTVANNLLKQLHFEDTVDWEDISLIRKIGEGKYGDVYKVLIFQLSHSLLNRTLLFIFFISINLCCHHRTVSLDK